MFDSEAKSALAEIGILWDATEKVVKRAERLRAEVVEPSINELRYAGRQLIDAVNLANKPNLTAEEQQKLAGHIHDCRLRCYCAQHDAFDASILFVQKILREYEEQFGLSLMHKHYPWLIDLQLLVHDADELIVDSRKSRGQRIEVYQTLGEVYLPKIVEQYKRLVTTRGPLIALFEEKDAEGRRGGYQFWTVIWVTIGAAIGGGAIGAILTILLTIYFHDIGKL